MTWRALGAALLAGGAMFTVFPVSAVAADDGTALAFRDPRISESSGLVDLGRVLVTANDSGHPARLFVVSPATGRTVGITDLHADALDVEALAPAGGAAVWVGDIGDNNETRKSISVYRVTVGVGVRSARPARYRLAYPHGAHNAESLFVDHRGQLYVITKSVMGGTVFRAPLRLVPGRVNTLVPAGRVIEYATDAAMLRDGRHVLVRGPERASVYTFPTFQRIGSFPLPYERQGEGVSVGPDSRILLSSEGMHSLVRRVVLPAAVAARMRPPAPKPTPTASPTASPAASPSGSPSASPSGSPSPSASASSVPSGSPSPSSARTRKRASTGNREGWLMWSIPGVIVLGAVGIGLGLRRRSE